MSLKGAQCAPCFLTRFALHAFTNKASEIKNESVLSVMQV